MSPIRDWLTILGLLRASESANDNYTYIQEIIMEGLQAMLGQWGDPEFLAPLVMGWGGRLLAAIAVFTVSTTTLFVLTCIPWGPSATARSDTGIRSVRHGLISHRHPRFNPVQLPSRLSAFATGSPIPNIS